MQKVFLNLATDSERDIKIQGLKSMGGLSQPVLTLVCLGNELILMRYGVFCLR